MESVDHLGSKPMHQLPNKCVGASTARHAQPQSLLVDVQYCKRAAWHLHERTVTNGLHICKVAVITGSLKVQGPGEMGLSLRTDALVCASPEAHPRGDKPDCVCKCLTN